MRLRGFQIIYFGQLAFRQWITARLFQFKNMWHRTGRIRKLPAGFPPERILIVATGLIGDTVMCVPAIEESRRIWPQAEITLLGRQHNCELLSSCPCVDRFHIVSAASTSYRHRSEILSLRAWLISNRFDLAIILFGDDFAHLLASAKIPVRIGSRGTLLEPCLTHTYDCASPQTWGSEEKLNALRSLGIDVRDVRPHLWVTESARISANKILAELGVPAGAPYAVIHPFGSEPRRWWPLDSVSNLAETITNRMSLTCILIGGPEVLPRITFKIAGSLVNAVGRFTLPELLSVVQGCNVIVSTDSGPFHIAGALNRPSIGLFRARRPEHANRYPSAQVIFGTDPSCNSKCTWNRCQVAPCRQMSNISVSQVLQQIQSLLDGSSHLPTG